MTEDKKSSPYAFNNTKNKKNIIATENEEILQPTNKENF